MINELYQYSLRRSQNLFSLLNHGPCVLWNRPWVF